MDSARFSTVRIAGFAKTNNALRNGNSVNRSGDSRRMWNQRQRQPSPPGYASGKAGGALLLSTSDLSSMPDIEALKVHMQRLAALTAVFSVDLGESQFTFDPRWTRHQQVAANINGCGDELYIHFLTRGCFIKGFAHESEMTPYKRADHSIWPGVLDSVPAEFQCSLEEPAFDPSATTFAIWRLATDNQWCVGDIRFPANDFKDGSADLLQPIGFTAAELTDWLSEDYETEVDSAIIESIFRGDPLSDTQMQTLNPDSPVHRMRDAVRATGYPTAT